MGKGTYRQADYLSLSPRIFMVEEENLPLLPPVRCGTCAHTHINKSTFNDQKEPVTKTITICMGLGHALDFMCWHWQRAPAHETYAQIFTIQHPLLLNLGHCLNGTWLSPEIVKLDPYSVLLLVWASVYPFCLDASVLVVTMHTAPAALWGRNRLTSLISSFSKSIINNSSTFYCLIICELL